MRLAPFRRVVLSYENSAHAHAYDTPNDASFSSPKSQPLSRGTREQQMIARMEVVSRSRFTTLPLSCWRT